MPKPKPNMSKDDNNQHMEPFLFKVVSHQKVSYASWPEFLTSLIDLKHYELRTRVRGAYTSRLEVDEQGGSHYKIITTNKNDSSRIPRFNSEIKKITTPAQSMSYRNPAKFYIKPILRTPSDVGIAVPLECSYPTLILEVDNYTSIRPFDAKTKEDAEKILADRKPLTSFEKLEERYKHPRIDHEYEYNEVLARLRWDETNENCRVVIFNDDIMSCLIAQARALDIYYSVFDKLNTENKATSQLKMPQIIFYSSSTLYLNDRQNNDLDSSFDIKMKPLAMAIKALKNGQLLPLEDISLGIEDFSRLSIHFNEALLHDYLIKIPDQAFSIISSSQADAWLWILRTHFVLNGGAIFTQNPSSLTFVMGDKERLVKFMHFLPINSRLDFIRLQVVSNQLGSVIRNLQDLLEIVSEFSHDKFDWPDKDKRLEFIQLENIAKMFNSSEFISNENDLIVLLRSFGTRLFCDFILSNKNAYRLYEGLATQGKHLVILRELKINPRFLSNNEHLLLKLTLFAAVVGKNYENDVRFSCGIKKDEQALVKNYINNQLTFIELVEAHHKNRPKTSNSLFSSAGSSNQEDLLDIIVPKKPKPKG